MTPEAKKLLEQAVAKAKAEYERLKNLLEPPTLTGCHACGHEYDREALGKYGCPNCHGEGLE